MGAVVASVVGAVVGAVVGWVVASVVGAVVAWVVGSVGSTGAQAVSSKAEASRKAIFTAVVF